MSCYTTTQCSHYCEDKSQQKVYFPSRQQMANPRFLVVVRIEIT